MSSRVASLALGLGVVVVALVPLYGDPRATPVSHAEWARMMVKALKVDQAIPEGAQASQVFSILSWKNSLALPADRYLSGSGVEVGAEHRISATGGTGDVSYALAVVRGGDYRLRLRVQGDAANPAEATLTPSGETTPVKSFVVVPQASWGWVEMGAVHLDPGVYTTSLALPPGTSMESLELAPPCLAPIEPLQGWRTTAITNRDDLATTLVKGLDAESELPPAAQPTEVAGSDLQVTSGASVSTAGASGPQRARGDVLRRRAGSRTLQRVGFRRRRRGPELARQRLPQGRAVPEQQGRGGLDGAAMAHRDDHRAHRGPALLQRHARPRLEHRAREARGEEDDAGRLRGHDQAAGVRSGAGRADHARPRGRRDEVARG